LNCSKYAATDKNLYRFCAVIIKFSVKNSGVEGFYGRYPAIGLRRGAGRQRLPSERGGAAADPHRRRSKKLDHPPLSKEDVHTLVYDIMNDAQRKAFEETHECDFSFELGQVARFRVNVFLQRKGEGAVFRTIPTKILTLEELGMPPILKQMCEKEKGLILVTGPTGSGKSTTLAAMIDYLNNTFEGHILTVEDPIVFEHQSK
jgi:Tfp pilus assembly pilus retraction ATPase PilT